MPAHNSPPWLLLQLADSAFPVGGFAHSAGLEAALQMGEAGGSRESLGWFCSELVNQISHGSLPFVNNAHEFPETLADLDRACDIFLSNHVANRASRVQGRALLNTCAQSFELPEFAALKLSVRERRLNQHHAPLFGVLCAALRMSLDETRQLFMYQTVRGVLSAAVRLNAVGPYEAQRMQVELIPAMDFALDETAHLRADDAAQTAPLLELFQMTHDRLYSRLFQS